MPHRLLSLRLLERRNHGPLPTLSSKQRELRAQPFFSSKAPFIGVSGWMHPILSAFCPGRAENLRTQKSMDGRLKPLISICLWFILFVNILFLFGAYRPSIVYKLAAIRNGHKIGGKMMKAMVLKKVLERSCLRRISLPFMDLLKVKKWRKPCPHDR
jgi:hypothetical protein